MPRRLFHIPNRPVNGPSKRLRGKKLRKSRRPLPRTLLIKPPEITVTSTQSRNIDSNPVTLSEAEKRQTAFDLRVQGHSLVDIARALQVTRDWVGNALREMLQDINMAARKDVETLRTLEMERLDRLLLANWPFRITTKGTEAILKIMERRHKLLGLEVTRHEHSGLGGGPISVTAASLDITQLSEEELHWLEVILEKSAPKALTGPDVTPPYVIEGEFKAIPLPATPNGKLQ